MVTIPQLTASNAHLDLATLEVVPNIRLTPREERGLALAVAGRVRRSGDAFAVEGSTGVYAVAFTGRKYGCSCPDATHAARPMHVCKHGHAVRFALERGLVAEEGK